MGRYSEEEAKQFIEYIAPIIKKEGNQRGYHIVSTTIAQAIIEGACGKSDLARLHHNHFGLKCGQNWLKQGKPSVNYKTGEEIKGAKIKINDWFRSYSDDTEGIKGYYNFIASARYANLRTAKNYEEFATFLKKDGYATSSTYIKTLCNTVKKYGLMTWDNIVVEYFPTVLGFDSIVEALNKIGVDSSRSYRKKIWNTNFSGTYLYTAEQNTMMLARMAEGKLIKP